MQTATRSATLFHHGVTLMLGAMIAAVIWLLGYAEISWLGFAAAAVYGETPGWRRARARLTRRWVP